MRVLMIAPPGGSVRARKARHSPLALSEQRTRGFGSVDHVASLLGLAGFCQAPERGRVGKNLGGLAHRQVLLDRDKNRLLHATMLDFSYLLELMTLAPGSPVSWHQGSVVRSIVTLTGSVTIIFPVCTPADA